jgi:hypothetical protein
VSANGESIASSSSTIQVGSELKQALERAASEQGFDATGLARRVLRECLEERRREAARGFENSVREVAEAVAG